MKQLLIFSLIIGVNYFSIAQTPEFTVTISSDTVNLSSIFEITFAFNGESSNEFEQPNFLDFEVVYRNQSTQMNITNGGVVRTISYTFGLKAKKEGNFIIEKATIKSNGTTYATDYLKIVVRENYFQKALPKSEEIDFWNPFDDFPKQEKITPKSNKKRNIYKI